MNILFVHNSRHKSAPWKDGSTRYRCYHLAESLRDKGFVADVTALPDVRMQHLERYRLVCVLRPHSSKLLDQLLKRCRRLGIRTIADVDDLVFISSFSALSPSVINGQASKQRVSERFERNLQAMVKFDDIIVATEPLARHWQEQTGKNNVAVIPNGMSERWLSTPVKRLRDSEDTTQTITYLPGSNSHDKDFSEIADVLAETLHGTRNARLLIVGTLNIDERVFPKGRIMRSSWIDYYKLPQVIAGSTVTLAPLVPSPFTYAKSHIKYIESAAFGTPAICSPNYDICRHHSSGLYIARKAEDWQEALQNILEVGIDCPSLNRMENQVRKTATAENSVMKLVNHLKNSGFEALENAA